MKRWMGVCVAAFLLVASTFAQVTQRVSVSSSGRQGNDGSAFASVSSDGRFVAFSSNASNLVAGDDSDPYHLDSQIFVHDRLTGTTDIVSVDSAGVVGNESSTWPVISADGRHVAFLSNATNLAPNCPGWYQVYVHDRATGATEVASRSTLTGGSCNAYCGPPAISADGRFVGFMSYADDLVANDFNGENDVFLRDLESHTTEIVSLASSGAQGNDVSFDCAISADGRFVAFSSSATNLVAADGNGNSDVFVRDRQLSTTELVSVDSSGVQANSGSLSPAISGDGTRVAFTSHATNLGAGGSPYAQTFVRDRRARTTVLASAGAGGVPANRDTRYPSMSLDGSCVGFTSEATNLDPAATHVSNAFVHEVEANTTEVVSRNAAGEGDQGSDFAAMSADGRFVGFDSSADNLVSGDTNHASDVFVHDRRANGFTSVCSPGTAGVIACPCANPASAPGMGCDNSSSSGGAFLSAYGGAYLSEDDLVFSTSGETPNATSILLQGTSGVANGVAYGQGVRCVGGTLVRLYTKTASEGCVTVPDVGAGDPSISARSAAKGDPIHAAESRWYLVVYRDPFVLGGCPAASAFNCTQTGRVGWSP